MQIGLKQSIMETNNSRESLLKPISFDEHLDKKYGPVGSASRREFEAKARAWYFAECLKDARKRAGLTQQAVADKIGKKREYVALVERGSTDVQLSTFMLMAEAVGLHLELVA